MYFFPFSVSFVFVRLNNVIMIKRNKVMQALGKKAVKGTHVVWLDQVLPMYRKDEWGVVAVIGMVKSTNHRFRVITIFEKNCDPVSQ